MTPLRVAVVNLVFEAAPDGPSLVSRWPTLTRFAEALSGATGARVAVLQRFLTDGELERSGVSYRFRRDGATPSPGLGCRVPGLSAALADLAPDVVHLNGFSFPAQLAELMLRTRRRPVFVVQHHAGPPEAGLRGFVQRRVTPCADGFFFTADGIAAPWRQRGVLGEKPVFEVVEGSCDFAPMERTAARAATGLDGDPAVLWVGRLHRRKDPMTALHAFGKALERLPGATLAMAFGDSALLPEVESFRRSLPGLAARVRLLGRLPHDELPAWYSAADLFLTSSPDEGSNYALIEAMACGAFPVASDIPAHRLLTAGGAHGALFPAGNAEAAGAALVAAASRSTPDARAATRKRFEEAASWPAIARQAERGYRTLVDARIPRTAR